MKHKLFKMSALKKRCVRAPHCVSVTETDRVTVCVCVCVAEIHRDFLHRPPSGYLPEEIWRKAGKSHTLTHTHNCVFKRPNERSCTNEPNSEKNNYSQRLMAQGLDSESRGAGLSARSKAVTALICLGSRWMFILHFTEKKKLEEISLRLNPDIGFASWTVLILCSGRLIHSLPGLPGPCPRLQSAPSVHQGQMPPVSQPLWKATAAKAAVKMQSPAPDRTRRS